MSAYRTGRLTDGVSAGGVVRVMMTGHGADTGGYSACRRVARRPAVARQ